VNGFVDLHVHSAPSLLPRHADDRGTAAAARRAGVTTIVLKAHEGSTAERAALLGNGAVGGIVLNSPVGGANPDAVRVAAQLGARIVWMPTISALCHQQAQQNDELSVHRGLKFATVPVCTDGRLDQRWGEVFEEVASADMVLASGHVSLDEALIAFTLARQLGVRRLLVNHPLMPFLGWRNDHATALMDLEAHIELGVLPDLVAGGHVSPTERLVRCFPAERLVFGSDLGHTDFPTFEDGLRDWVPRLTRLVGETAAVRIMTVTGHELLAA
jgi:Family of unknown function (DUF6282)